MTVIAKPRALIFDWDNTLVDSWACLTVAINRTLVHMGHGEWSAEEVKERVALSMRDAFPALFGDRWTEARDVFTRSFAEIHLDYLKELPGRSQLLQSLAAEGLWLAVVSNKRGSFLRDEAEVLGWNKLFAQLVGAGDAERDKPDPAPVHLALAGSGIAPGPDVWFLGDNLVDLQCAVNAGCVPVLLRQEDPKAGELEPAPPRYHLRDGGELLELLKVPICGI